MISPRPIGFPPSCRLRPRRHCRRDQSRLAAETSSPPALADDIAAPEPPDFAVLSALAFPRCAADVWAAASAAQGGRVRCRRARRRCRPRYSQSAPPRSAAHLPLSIFPPEPPAALAEERGAAGAVRNRGAGGASIAADPPPSPPPNCTSPSLSPPRAAGRLRR